MAAQRRFLNAPFGAYAQAVLPPPDETLAQVGPGTPGGEYLRRFWHPVAQTQMLGDLPVAIRILGEDLVIFRDGAGRIGLLERHCSHRGTSLEFGKIEEHGIRCCYHGWQFDIDGAILDTPAEPEDTPYKGKLYHGAYPVIEHGGLVFAYMGPPDKKPPFRKFPQFEDPTLRISLAERMGGNPKPCNWLQIMDNVVDQVHEAFLHAQISGPQFLNDDGELLEELAIEGEDDYWETPQGILCHEARRVGEYMWVRSLEFVCPNVIQLCRLPHFPLEELNAEETEYGVVATRWRVPVDDTNTVEFAFVYSNLDETEAYFEKPWPADVSNAAGRPYEETQRVPGDFEAQVGQRPIAIHATEHLATSDRGVAMMRRMLREGIETVERGADPRGVTPDGAPLPNYARETVKRAPAAATPQADAEQLRRYSEEIRDRAFAGAK
ncbi:MAG: aromatic ring-hydroxylating dioxygenase subunit alpha [Proteobacteria bacterium]|nr:aromatic ring-hydroxylating dioxygenase subunit alpha [Pseudomonadota bacterium]